MLENFFKIYYLNNMGIVYFAPLLLVMTSHALSFRY